MPASSDRLEYLPIHVLSHLIAADRLTPSTLVDLFLNRIATLDAKLHAFVSVDAATARLAAEAATKSLRAGYRLGPLHGIPIALKDLIEIEGQVTSGGSLTMSGRISETTATLVRRLTRAGMIVLGKAHTCEFAVSGWGTNQHLGTPWNPWHSDVHYIPGGSSSGSAVSVAAGLTPCAIGTDTGGSVRLPASFCGIVGLKTTVGRISRHGILATSPSLDSVGPLTRSVEDAALLFDSFQGEDPLDPATVRVPRADVLCNLKRGIRGLRIGLIAEPERRLCDGEVLARYDAASKVLEELGADIVEAHLPRSFADYQKQAGRIITPESYAIWGPYVDRPELSIDENVRARILPGRDVKVSDYCLAVREREQLKREYAEATAELDAILTPTTPTPAIPVADVNEKESPSLFTRAGNFLDLCALALPAGFNSRGLPVSIQIMTMSYDEATALRIGWAYEQAAGWSALPPGI